MQKIDIEKLLQWAYREELPKRQLSPAESLWNHVSDYGQSGWVNTSNGSPQRYSDFVMPEPDAIAIEKAVSEIADYAIDWDASLDDIAGPLSGLVSVNKLYQGDVGNPNRKRTVGWTDQDTGKRQTAETKPRDMLMVSTVRPKQLIVAHARMGTRPEVDEQPLPHKTPGTRGPGAMLIGKCVGKDRYTPGSYHPLQWRPSPMSVILERAEYVAWWQALDQLAERLNAEQALAKFAPLPPSAPRTPWLEPGPVKSGILHTPSVEKPGRLSFAQKRSRMLAPFQSRTLTIASKETAK